MELVRPERLDKFIELNYLTGSRTRDLLACSVVSQPLRYGMPSDPEHTL
jgi:hypothetical protein